MTALRNTVRGKRRKRRQKRRKSEAVPNESTVSDCPRDGKVEKGSGRREGGKTFALQLPDSRR